jgi:preprotein translocase subunit YajC
MTKNIFTSIFLLVLMFLMSWFIQQGLSMKLAIWLLAQF